MVIGAQTPTSSAIDAAAEAGALRPFARAQQDQPLPWRSPADRSAPRWPEASAGLHQHEDDAPRRRGDKAMRTSKRAKLGSTVCNGGHDEGRARLSASRR